MAVLTFLASPSPTPASATPATNDNYLTSWIIPDAAKVARFRPVREVTRTVTENTTGTTTQADLFNPNIAGQAFGGGGAEPLTCNHVTYGATVWYDLHPDVPMAVTLIASGYPSTLAIYQYDARTAKLDHKSVLCRASSVASNQFVVSDELQAGKAYTVQVAGLQSGPGFASGPLQFTTNLFPDHDSDHVLDGVDKCPFLQGVQRFGGCPPMIAPRPALTYDTVGSGIRLTSLMVATIPSGARVEARCRRCGVRQVVHSGRHADSATLSRFNGVAMQQGARLEIWVTKSAVKKAGRPSDYRYGAIGSYISYTVRDGKLGSRVLRCLIPGSRRPRRSCT